MLRKLLNGMIFGAGFGIAFIVIWFGAFFWFVPLFYGEGHNTGDIRNKDKELSSAPLINSRQRFLGSTGYYSGDFIDNKSGILTNGPGSIIGKVSVNNKPLQGLKIRLALNGSVLSQWAVSDLKGEYKISVPYGQYNIDGYELDYQVVNALLPGKIGHPENPLKSQTFDVLETNTGRGLSLSFIDPVIRKIHKSNFSISEDVSLEWEPYPGATKYSIQLYEKTNPNIWSNTTLFKWSDKPVVAEPSINVRKAGAQLKRNHYYVLMVYALDNDNNILSQTTDIHDGYDFEAQ